MQTKTLLASVALLLVCTLTLKSQTTGNSVTEVILSGYTARSFTTEPVKDSDIDLILQCGIKAPSARNSQPWRFTVVKNKELIADIIPNTTDGNVLIVVSGQETTQPGMFVDFDCGLATENMCIAAQSLGLGAHIYAGPVNNVNTNMKQVLEIPDGYNAVAILRIGNIDTGVDAVSSASARKQINELVN
jgi:nitroreductase